MLQSYRQQLNSEQLEQYEKLMAGQSFSGRKQMIRDLLGQDWIVCIFSINLGRVKYHDRLCEMSMTVSPLNNKNEQEALAK